MKRVIILIMLLIAVAFLIGCNDVKQSGLPVNEELLKKISSHVDGEFSYDNGLTAERNGDTYCERCNKFIEGKVRICTFCGQYI